MTLALSVRDSLEDFRRSNWTFGGRSFDLYTGAAGGPSVLLLHELPNLTPEVAGLARELQREGFQITMPSLIGDAGEPSNLGLKSLAAICVRSEFNALFSSETPPVVTWIRGLLGELAKAGKPVGVVGLCFSGGFALASAIEPSVAAVVSCQPALPLAIGSKIDISAADRRALRGRLDSGALAGLVYRFQDDHISPCQRLGGLQSALGDQLLGRCLPGNDHSVITHDLKPGVTEPTFQARQEVIAFLRWRLLGACRPSPPPTVARCFEMGCARNRQGAPRARYGSAAVPS